MLASLAANSGEIDAKILYEQIHHSQFVQARLQAENHATRESTKREIEAHAFTKMIVDKQWETCTKLYALLESQEELMAADIQGKSETINRLQDFLQRCEETVIILEQRVLRLEETMAAKDEIIKILHRDLRATE